MSETFAAGVTVAPDDPVFDGHFPGEPILPGVAQVGLIVDTLASICGKRTPLHEICVMRLRQLVRPGERLELSGRMFDDGLLRCELKRDGAVVSNAVLRLQPSLPASPPAHALPAPLCPAPLPPLPQQPPMRLATQVLHYTEQGLHCEARVPRDCAFAHDGRAPAYACIEAAAQCAASWEALRRAHAGGTAAPRLGYLVGMREIQLFAEDVPAEQPMLAAIVLREVAMPLSRYAIEVAMDSRIVACGVIDTVLSGRAPA